MKIEVIGRPHYHAHPDKPTQHILATYNPRRETTAVDCNVDIVTLGIVFNVLQEQYEKYLGTLKPDLAERIRETTRKAVFNHAQD